MSYILLTCEVWWQKGSSSEVFSEDELANIDDFERLVRNEVDSSATRKAKSIDLCFKWNRGKKNEGLVKLITIKNKDEDGMPMDDFDFVELLKVHNFLDVSLIGGKSSEGHKIIDKWLAKFDIEAKTDHRGQQQSLLALMLADALSAQGKLSDDEVAAVIKACKKRKK